MSNASDLYFEHTKSQSQYAYFQLGMAAGAIAFAVHQTQDMKLSDAPWPLGLAVALWALSFFLGCAGLEARTRGLASNTRFLFASDEVPPELQQALRDLPEYEEWKESITDELTKPIIRFRLQVWMLFAGALSYIAGHVMLMAAQ